MVAVSPDEAKAGKTAAVTPPADADRPAGGPDALLVTDKKPAVTVEAPMEKVVAEGTGRRARIEDRAAEGRCRLATGAVWPCVFARYCHSS